MPRGKRTQPPRGRLPSYKGGIVVSSWRGRPRISSWPKKPPKKRNPTNEQWTNWLKAANFIYRYQPMKVQAENQRVTKGTPWMPRDLFISALRGNLFQLVDDEGHKYHTMTQKQEVSATLDIVAQLEGEMMYRSSGLWVPIPAGNDGEVLTFDDANKRPEWRPSTGGGGGIEPVAHVVVDEENAPQVTLANIPENAHHLRLLCHARASGGVTLRDLLMRFNDDSSSTYNYVTALMEGSGITTGSAASQTAALIGRTLGGSMTPTASSVTVVDIPYPRNATHWTQWHATGSHQTGTSAANARRTDHAGTWRNTDPIESITLLPNVNDLAPPSEFTLYAFT